MLKPIKIGGPGGGGHLFTIAGTTTHCLIKIEGNINSLGTRSIV